MTATTLAALVTVMVFPAAGGLACIHAPQAQAVASLSEDQTVRMVAAVVAAARDLLGVAPAAVRPDQAVARVPAGLPASPAPPVRIPRPAPLREALLDLPPPVC
jgi:hypothetical protein